LGGTSRFSGRLLYDGQPLTQVKLAVNYKQGASQSLYTYARTEATGQFCFYGLPTGQRSLYLQLEPRGKWINLGKYEFEQGQSLELGDMEVPLSEVQIDLKHEDGTLPEPGWSVKLQAYESETFWGNQVGTMAEHESGEESFTFMQLSVGSHEAIASKEGYPTIRQILDIHPGQQTHTVTMTIPTGSASLTGHVTFIGGGSLAIEMLVWNEDQTIVHLSAPLTSEDNTFEVAHLPAGEYTIARASLFGRERHLILSRVSVQSGEDRVVNVEVDPEASQYPDEGYLRAIIVDEQGVPVATPYVWLENNGKVIEPSIDTDFSKTFMGEPGRYELHVEYPGFQTQDKPVTMKSRHDTSSGKFHKPVIIELKKRD
jgi:hypothetical protein